MFASQLIRILQTFPTNENNEICDFDTDEVKENNTMKESPKRYTNPFLSDEENEKVNSVNSWNNQELYTDKKVMEECELPELLVCYKEGGFHVKDICVDEGIILPHGEKILFNEENHDILCISSNEDRHDDIINGSLEEMKFTPIEDFYKESNSISNHQMEIQDNLDEELERNLEIQVKDSQNLIPVKDCEEDVESVDENSEFAPEKLKVSEESDTVSKAIDSYVPEELKNVCKEDVENSEFAPEKLELSEETDSVSKAIDSYAPEELKNVCKDADDENSEFAPEKLELCEETDSVSKAIDSYAPEEQDRPLPSLKSLLESIHGVNDKSHVEETLNMPPIEGNEVGTSVQISNESIEETTNGKTVINDVLQVPENALEHNVIISNPVQRGEGESSFSVANPVSGLITYSGQIAFSGSVSLRSDSSTTSTRSFAFPILQNEWNSSPVRMAKADRRRLQKQRGWKHGILCCRF